jgi:hypothetical protein
MNLIGWIELSQFNWTQLFELKRNRTEKKLN